MSRRGFSIIYLIPLTICVSCSDLRVGRTYLSEMEHDDSRFFAPREDFPVMGGDTGREWMTERERRERTPASQEVLAEDRRSRVLRAELRELEGLQSEESVQFYERYKGALHSTSEKIYFLKLAPHERRDYLITRGIISERKPAAFDLNSRMNAVRNQDIALGMSKQDVLMSWGRPARVEVAGNPKFENERWLYRTDRFSKYIYFEAGQVQGWE